MASKSWMLWLVAIAVTAVAAWFGSLYVSERPNISERVDRKSLPSAVLGETREYLVHLPEGYERHPEKRYAVIYVLDGSSQDLHTAASAALMARIGVIDEVIVVGVPNVSGAGRQRDYTPPGMRRDTDPDEPAQGEGDQFLSFIERELVAAIEAGYRASDVRMLAGNSRGGLFVVYALTARPALFDAYIANSPALWRDDAAMVERMADFLRSHDRPEASLFLSLGEEENDKMRAAFDSATEILDRDAPPGLRWRAYISAGAGHQDNAARATPVALKWINEAAP